MCKLPDSGNKKSFRNRINTDTQVRDRGVRERQSEREKNNNGFFC
jgi:hypothetical protein